MSSIYRKGRDGYFYYQAYIFNDKTSKKDKRVFHSLNTKDRKEAELKKKNLDRKYESDDHTFKTNFNKFKIKKAQFWIPITLPFVLYLVFTYNILPDTANTQRTIEPNKIPFNDDLNLVLDKSDLLIKKNIMKKDNKIQSQKNEDINTLNKNRPLPEYTIHRTENLSSAFDQCKIYLTVVDTANEYQILKICEDVNLKFSKYSNIIINVYSDSKSGIEMASGKIKNFDANEQSMLWLAMYTFNSVEGEYFDYKPGTYLGVN